MEGFGVGATFGLIISMVSFVFVSLFADIDFKVVERKYTNSVELCEKLGSKPASVDTATVTCENDIEVNWR